MWCESGLALGHFLKGKISTVVMIMLLYSSKLYHRAMGGDYFKTASIECQDAQVPKEVLH